MKRLALTVSTAGAAIAAAAVLSATGSAQDPGTTTLQLFERDKGSTFGFVDNPPKAKGRREQQASVGDVFAFGTPVFDESRKTRLGTLDVQCTITRPGTEATSEAACTGAFRLRNGTIALTGAFKGDPKTVVIPITGGTGDYNGVRGTLRSTSVKGGSVDVLEFLP